MLTQAAASDSKAKFYSVRPSDILSKYQGESERYLSNLFTEARSQGRAIIFFDGKSLYMHSYFRSSIIGATYYSEFDCIAITRGCSEEGLQCRRLLSELLLQLTHQQQLNIIDSALHETATSANTDSLLKSNISDDNISNRKENSGKVIVVAATNRLQDLDEAVVRRFDTKVTLTLLFACLILLYISGQSVFCSHALNVCFSLA